MNRALRRAGAAAGILGPVAFTIAWAINGARQPGYPVVHEHISGLAAPEAEHPGLMMAGFVALGTGTIALGLALQDALGPGVRRSGPGPALLMVAGAAQVAAGFLRRDTLLLNPPGRPEGHRQSWHNDGHDASAGVAYACALLAPLTLAARFAGDDEWSGLAVAGPVSAGLSGALMAWFALDVDRKGNGVVQRTMVTVPQVFMIAVAVRLLRRS